MNTDPLQQASMRVARQTRHTPSLQPSTAEPWMDDALCAQADADMFFPEGQGASAAEAKRLCALCPVQDECLSFALEHRLYYGVWGGLTDKQRRRLRRGAA